ncbi:hypothetical protein OG884_17990 [Streptosporangium sp. NBC_01755]|uniref:hypothetical protein n=1 Tax=unclassified Streptosporangium TaxID=2632669 RepID=UPI002DDBB43B|nr:MULTISPECIES: hypothetical protein [unclassified Streptosporangium]WSA24970.1 hypothetical protein OIE13_29175 [Streptosporangium sp. NBC_01810]WSD03698.1 hypothetical protein OG884_17990 [Streptosporangium sp. NBC_01755]
MIVLGLLLVVLASATVIAVSWDETAASTTTATFTVFDRVIQLTQLELFFAGVATGAVLLLGLGIMFAGMRRSSSHRRRLRASRAEARDRVTRLEEEKRELERKLEATPAASRTLAAATAPAAPAADRDRDRDGVDDRAEDTAPHPRVEVPHQSSTDQLVAGRHGRSDRH